MVFSVTYTICEGLENWMRRGLIESRLLIACMIPFVDTRNLFNCENIYIVTFRVAHWDAWDDSVAV